MANGPEHMRVGAASGCSAVALALVGTAAAGYPVVSSPLTSALLIVVAAPIGVLHALLPDIDLRGTLSRWLGWIGAGITAIVRSLSVVTTGRAHRGMTHTWWFVVLSALPWVLVHPVLVVAALSGGASHLLLDTRLAKTWRKLYRTAPRPDRKPTAARTRLPQRGSVTPADKLSAGKRVPVSARDSQGKFAGGASVGRRSGRKA